MLLRSMGAREAELGHIHMDAGLSRWSEIEHEPKRRPHPNLFDLESISALRIRPYEEEA